MKKKKTTKWEDFKFWLFLKKMRLIIKLYELKYYILKLRHCNKGFHFFEKDSIKVSVNGVGYKKGWSRKTDFFKCRVCGCLLFLSEKDKRKWIFIEKRENKCMKEFVKSTMENFNRKNENKRHVKT